LGLVGPPANELTRLDRNKRRALSRQKFAIRRCEENGIQRPGDATAHPQLGPARPEIAEDAPALVIERWLALRQLTEDGAREVSPFTVVDTGGICKYAYSCIASSRGSALAKWII
jgi:hypothetical protein